MVALVSESASAPSSLDFEVREVLPSPLETYHPVRVIRSAIHLRRHLRDTDVVHSFIAYPYLPVAALALLGTSTPLFVSALGTYAVEPLEEWKTRPLLQFGYSRAEEVLCISEYTERRIKDLSGIEHTAVVPLGVDLDHYGAENVQDEGFILCVGAVKRRKGQDVLLGAFGEISDEFPEIELVFAGPVHEEPYFDEITQQVSDLEVDDRVEFLGAVPEDRLKELYRSCTVFALTPRVINDNFEGFGLVYLEAAAYNKPAVGTKSGGVPTAVVDGETGILAEEDDVDGVADALRTLLGDDDYRLEMGQQARKNTERLTWKRYAGELHNRFTSVR